MNLRYIREEAELTQWQVAEILNVSRSVYGMWETEADFIPLLRLNDFCTYFDVSFDYVLGLSKIRNYHSYKNIIDRNIIKERLKNLRKEYNLTQDRLSQKLGITRSLISKYENGTNLILTCFVIAYAKFFNVSADYLVGRIDTEVILKEPVKN